MQRPALLGVFLAGLILAAWLPGEKVVAQQAPVLLQKVEAQRGQPLTPEQRQQFSRTTAGLRETLLPARQKFVRTIAQAFRLPQSDVQALLPAIGADNAGFDNKNMIQKIEARLGRPITPQEMQQMRAADNAEKAEMSEIQSRYAAELAQIVGLSKEQIQRMLPNIGI